MLAHSCGVVVSTLDLEAGKRRFESCQESTFQSLLQLYTTLAEFTKLKLTARAEQPPEHSSCETLHKCLFMSIKRYMVCFGIKIKKNAEHFESLIQCSSGLWSKVVAVGRVHNKAVDGFLCSSMSDALFSKNCRLSYIV